MLAKRKQEIIANVQELLESAEVCASMLGGGMEGSKPEDYAEAILGVSTDIPAIIYSSDKVIRCLMRLNRWKYEEASEWYNYNTVRAAPYMPNPPIFVEEV